MANLHLGNNQWVMSVQREGKDGAADTQNPHVSFNLITPGYLDAVAIVSATDVWATGWRLSGG